MSKKVKSLIVAGLLVVGMSGNVFAHTTFEGNDTNTSIVTEQHEGLMQAKIENPKAGETYTLQDGNVVVKIGEDGKTASISVNDGSPVVVKIVHMKGGNGFNCYNADEEELIDMICPPNGGGKQPGISHITIFFDLVDKTDSDGDGIPDIKDDTPVPPEEPKDPEITDPETGDKSMIAFGAAVVIAGGVVYVLNKKKDDDEE